MGPVNRLNLAAEGGLCDSIILKGMFLSLCASMYYTQRWDVVCRCPNLSYAKKRNGTVSRLMCGYITQVDRMSANG